VSDQPIQLTRSRAAPVGRPLVERRKLERRARRLAWGGIGYHVLEAAVAVGAGLAAGSIALIGFGADSLIESVAGLIVVWLFTGARLGSTVAERRAQQLIAISFYVLAAYVGIESVRSLLGGHEPEVSWLGIGLAAFTVVTMPLLAAWKRRVGRALNSSAAVKEASQTQLCASSRPPPKDGDARAAFAVLETTSDSVSASIHRTGYDALTAAREMRTAGPARRTRRQTHGSGMTATTARNDQT
jgi:divalent metal cation (Fe/Co/Zn/Cd) transporter